MCTHLNQFHAGSFPDLFILSFIYDVYFLKIEMAAKKKAGAKSSKKVKAGAKSKTTR
jgi:hypothetical protein